MPVIIGLLGRKRSGKDTFAARLVEAHGFARYAFADNVRQAALDLDPIIPYPRHSDAVLGLPHCRLSEIVDAVGWEAAKEHPEVRRTLQRFGSESIRTLDPDFWVRTVMNKIRADGGNAVITDVRFPNEADAVTATGGYTVRVRRPGDRDTPDTHISETALDDHIVDHVALNDGTIDDLHRAADAIARGARWGQLEGDFPHHLREDCPDRGICLRHAIT